MTKDKTYFSTTDNSFSISAFRDQSHKLSSRNKKAARAPRLHSPSPRPLTWPGSQQVGTGQGSRPQRRLLGGRWGWWLGGAVRGAEGSRLSLGGLYHTALAHMYQPLTGKQSLQQWNPAMETWSEVNFWCKPFNFWWKPSNFWWKLFCGNVE